MKVEKLINFNSNQKSCIVQLPGIVEYTNWFSANDLDFSNQCLGYDIKLFDSKLLGIWSTIAPRFTLTKIGNTW